MRHMTQFRAGVVAAMLSLLLAVSCGQNYYDTVVQKRVEQLSAKEIGRAHV